jgi:hypothetical protein
MKKIVFVCIAFVAVSSVFAQSPKKPAKTGGIIEGAGDHLMFQLNTNYWAGMPDSIQSHKKGLSRGINVYFMLNKPFKSNPQFAVAFGLGAGTTNMYFKNSNIDIKSTATRLPFTSLDSTDRFKKYKLTVAYLELPLELRFVKNPERENKSFKAAIGIKLGTLLNVHTKGKTLQNKNGNTLNTYTQKESNRHFFNSTKVAATGRIGYGNFSLNAGYQFTSLLKDGVGPEIHPFEIGLTLSGL